MSLMHGVMRASTLTPPSSSGGLVLTEIEVDFGTKPIESKTFTIADAACTTLSLIIAVQSGNVATGRAGNDAEWDSVTYAAKPGSGSFTLIAHASGPISGKRKVLYSLV